MRRSWIAVLVMAASCTRPGEVEQQRLVREARERFTPPADGRLTEKQVAAYARARRGAREGDADSGEASLDFARRGGMNGEEFLWVRQRVFDAVLSIEQADAQRRNTETFRRSIESLRRVLASTSDPATRATVERQIAELERESADSERAGARSAPGGGAAANETLVRRHWADLAPGSASSRR
jgi:hypothetical protein